MTYNIHTEKIYALGDIHGSLMEIAGHIRKYDLRNCALIFCGDIGFGFEKTEYYEQIYQKLRPLLSRNNIYCYFVRGNHDNPDLFDGKQIAHKRFTAVEDYSVIRTFPMEGSGVLPESRENATEDSGDSVPTNSILCVGGAISIDRTYRQRKMEGIVNILKLVHGFSSEEAEARSKKLYWENEPPFFNEKALDALREDKLRITAVCSHSCPSFCEPFSKHGIAMFLDDDPPLAKDIDRERETLDQVWQKLRQDGHPLRSWFYGHYHYHYRAEHEGVCFTMLDMAREGRYDMVEISTGI